MKSAKEKQYTVTLDDDPSVRLIVEAVLRLPSLPFSSTEGLLSKAATLNPTAAFIDIQLGESRTGVEVIPQLRRHWPYATIIVLTASQQDQNIQTALDYGADDFIRKPISTVELLARFQVRSRQAEERRGQYEIGYGGLRLDIATNRVCIQNISENPSRMVFNILRLLVLAKGQTVDKPTLISSVWGQTAVSANALDQKMLESRRLLKKCGAEVQIVSSYGKGWRLAPKSY